MYVERKERSKGVITFRRLDKNLKLVNELKFPMKSMTTNYWRLQYGHMQGTLSPLTIGVNGVNSFGGSGGSSSIGFRHRFDATSEDTFWGVRVGTSSQEMKIDDIALYGLLSDSVILHLNSSLSFTDTSFKAKRLFQNISGSTIGINEIGLYGYRANSLNITTSMFARDVLEEEFNILDEEFLEAEIEMEAVEGGRNFNFWWSQAGSSANNTKTFFRRNGDTATNTYNTIADIRNGFSNRSERGIFLGSGNTPVSFTDIDLDERYEHGTDENELSNLDLFIEDFEVDEEEGHCGFLIRQQIENLSGEDLIIREMGLFGAATTNPGFLLDRFILPTPIVFPNGAMREARWRISYTI